MLHLTPTDRRGSREADASVIRFAHRVITSAAGVTNGTRLRALVAAALLVVACALPAAAAAPITLTDPAASPQTATPQTPIVFSVTYRDQAGLAPSYVRVSVAGSVRTLHAVTDGSSWAKGVRFFVATGLPAGTWPTRFEAADTQGNSTSVAGPTVVIGSGTPTPTPVPTPTPTPHPTPTPTPRPTPTPTPRPTPTPTPKPTPNPTPTPTPRPTPTPKPAPTPTPAPTATARPAATPAPRSTSAPTPAPGATQAPTTPPVPTATTPSAGDPTATPDSGTASGPAATQAPLAVIVPGSAGGPGDGSASGPGGTGGTGGGPAGGPGGGSTLGPGALGGSGAAGASLSGGLGGSSASAIVARLIPAMIVTTGGVAMAMAFLAFGKRRRDETPTAPDAVLAAAAASGMDVPAASRLVPGASASTRGAPAGDAASVAASLRAAVVAVPAEAVVDGDLPRWRRPSLMEARKADPTRTVNATVNLRFEGQAGDAVSGLERRRIRYRLVGLLDQPDDVRGVQIGTLDEGDEVVLIERHGTYWLVLCPDGREGWLHKMVLGDAVGGETAAQHAASWTSGDEGPAPGSFEDVLRIYTEHRRQMGEA